MPPKYCNSVFARSTLVSAVVPTLFCATCPSLPALCSTKSQNTPSSEVSREASADVRITFQRIIATNDNRKLPFAIIDKKNAAMFVFDADGSPLSSEPVLLGISKCDTIDPKTLNAKLGDISSEKRVTPSGKYQAQIGRDLHGKELLWVKYDYAIAIHPVIDVPGQQRVKRLQSQTAEDNRITWGCINASSSFYKTVISPVFKPKGGIVYVLPEEIAVDVFIDRELH